jgi:hypothetical protein
MEEEGQKFDVSSPSDHVRGADITIWEEQDFVEAHQA